MQGMGWLDGGCANKACESTVQRPTNAEIGVDERHTGSAGWSAPGINEKE